MIKIEIQDDQRVVVLVPGTAVHKLLQGLHDAMTVSKLTTPELQGYVVFDTLKALDLDSSLMTFKVLLWFSRHHYADCKSYKDTSIWILNRKGESILAKLNKGETLTLKSTWGH